MQKLRVTTTITVVREVPFDTDHYLSMSLDEALAYERGERPLEKDKGDIVGEFAETVGDGADSVIVRVEVLDAEGRVDLRYAKPVSRWSSAPQANTSAERDRRAAADEALEHESTPGLAHEGYAEDRARAAREAEEARMEHDPEYQGLK